MSIGHQLRPSPEDVPTGTIQSQGPWDTLLIDIVGPLPLDHRHEFLIVFMDCYSKYTILIPSSNHTANTVSEALMWYVIPYFGTPRRLLSDHGRKFISAIWTKLLHSLGIQQVLTSPYHTEGNAINERSYRTLNNMLHARHEPQGFSALMIATGSEPTLPPDLTSDASPSTAAEDPAEYVETIRQRLQLTHQQMAALPTAPTSNPYQIGSLIFALITPPEPISKLAPQWKGPYCVCRIPNEYQVVYEDGEVKRTIHVNRARPAKFTAPDLPEPVPLVEELCPPLVYLPAGFTHKPSKPCAPPVNRNEAAMPPPAVPTVPAPPLPAAAPANQNPETAPPRRHSPRLNPELGHAHAIKSQPLCLNPAQRTVPRWPAHTRSQLATMTPWDQGRTLSLLPACAWWISATATAST